MKSFQLSLPALLVLLQLLALSVVHAQEHWTFIDNGRIRLGVNMDAGGYLGRFSRSRSDENVLDSFDDGPRRSGDASRQRIHPLQTRLLESRKVRVVRAQRGPICNCMSSEDSVGQDASNRVGILHQPDDFREVIGARQNQSAVWKLQPAGNNMFGVSQRNSRCT